MVDLEAGDRLHHSFHFGNALALSATLPMRINCIDFAVLVCVRDLHIEVPRNGDHRHFVVFGVKRRDHDGIREESSAGHIRSAHSEKQNIHSSIL